MIYKSFTFVCYNKKRVLHSVLTADKHLPKTATKEALMENTCVILEDFVQYLTVIRNRSPRTVSSYRTDLIIFLTWLIARRRGISSPSAEQCAKMPLAEADEAMLTTVQRRDILEFLAWASTERGNCGRSRSRKLSALKTFFRYHTTVARTLKTNPTADIDAPSQKKTLPRYLNEEESIALLKAVLSDEESKTVERDYAILTLFLNCGMRLSELTAINLSDIDSSLQSLRVLGKGAKERVIYLNNACREALTLYFPKRDLQGQVHPDSKNALFLSSQHRRISNRTVQWMVYKYLAAADLAHKYCSVHKLRHTAATLMYRSGEVDIRVLKDILGHEQLSTTQIYTHVSDTEMERAMTQNPLAALNPSDISNKS